MILLERSFTAHIPLLMATSAFGLESRHKSSPQQCVLHRLCTIALYKCSNIYLWKIIADVLAWLSVWSEVQIICIWSSWCHCHPIIFCSRKIQKDSPFLVPAYASCPGKKLLNGCSVVVVVIFISDYTECCDTVGWVWPSIRCRIVSL